MLVGRREECGRIDALVADAGRGVSGVLVIRGDAGVGKTALLEYARSCGEGLRVLTARGVEAESDLAYSGLEELFRPVMDRIHGLESFHGRVLASAFGVEAPRGGVDRFAVCAATLALLGVLSEESPLVVVVDDAHWMDASSVDAIAFSGRRVAAEGVAMLISVRSAAPAAGLGVLAPFDRIDLTGLDAEASATVLSAGPQLTVDVAVAVTAGCAGNPLALWEVPRMLSDPQRRGVESLGDPLVLDKALARAFGWELDRLSADGHAAALVAAAGEGDRTDQVMSALDQLGVSRPALAEVESLDIVSIGATRVVFRHPLLRSTAYYAASPSQRRHAHAALAAAVDGDIDGARRAWHLAASCVGADESVAALLDATGRDAAERGARRAAGAAMLRAAELSSNQADRARRLVESAHQLIAVGDPGPARSLLDDALALTTDAQARARINLVRGHLELLFGSGTASARELLAGEAARIEGIDPTLAAMMFTEITAAHFMDGDMPAAFETAERADDLANRAGGGPWQLVTKLQRGMIMVCRGETREGCALVLECAPALAGAARSDPEANALVYLAANVLVWAEQIEPARSLLTEAIRHSRAVGALSPLPALLGSLAGLEYRTGEWAACTANCWEAVNLGEQLGDIHTYIGRATAGMLSAARGDASHCYAQSERIVKDAASIGGATMLAWSKVNLAVLELGLGHPDKAAAQLEPVERFMATTGIREPNTIPWQPELAEAYVRTGQPDRAGTLLEELEAQADQTGGTWSHAVAGRVRGLLADEGEMDGAFGDALGWHARIPRPFEQARTRLCYGEKLRRHKRIIEARSQLAQALETFDRLGATPWSQRALDELRATGATPHGGTNHRLHELTAQELQIALRVAEGATNREVARTLFLSPKTIESHLSHIYRKLAIHRRSELAHLIATRADNTVVPPAR